MKRKFLLFLLLLALFAPWTANGQNRTIVTIGDGTSSHYYPLPGFYGFQYDVFLYTPSAATELSVDSDISSIAFNVKTNSATTGAEMYIWVKDVDANYTLATSTTFADYITGATQVYANDDFTSTAGWNTFNFSSTFSHEAGKALLVAVHGVGCSTSGGCSRYCYYTSAPNTYWYKHVDGTDPGQAVTGAVSGNRANIQLDLTFTGSVCFAPTNLTYSNITESSATLSWTESGTSTAWTLEYGTAADFTGATSVPVSDTPSTSLSGLSALTTYYVRVKADCDSEWLEGSFSTTAVAEAVNNAWADDFEGTSLGWELINGSLPNKWCWGTAVNNGGTHALYISNDNGTTNAYTISSAAMVYATKLLSFTEGKFEFSYNWIANGESTYDYLRVALVPASVTLTAGTTVPSGFSATALPTGWIALDGGGKLNLNSTWQSESIAINVTAGNYYLVMAWRNDGTQGYQPPAAFDNVSITKVACDFDVTDLAASDITTSGATLSWDGGEASQWQVAYSTASDFEGATEEIVDEASYDMTGLQDNTTYYVRVRAYCGGNDFGAWTNMQFKTACLALTDYPWRENFDSYSGTTSGSVNNLPDCWNYYNGTNYSYYAGYPVIYNNSSYSNSGNNHLYLYSYYSSSYTYTSLYAILPAMENLEGKQLSLYARAYNTSSSFTVGMMTDPNDISTFVEVGSKSPSTTAYEEFTFILGQGNCVAIMMEPGNSSSTYHGIRIDDITIDFPPTCPKPSGLAYADVTGHGATLSWTENGEAEAWQICLNDDEENLIDVTENPYTLTGLAEETAFTVKVRANCGGNDGVSEWSNVVSFTTPQACPAPTGLTVSNITGHNATLNWNGSSDSYNVMYRTKASAEGLFEDFSTSPDWGKYTGLLEYVLNDSIELATTTSGWNFNTGNGVFDRHAKINIWSTSIKYWLVTPSVEVAENYMFSFDLALTKFGGTLEPVADTLQQDDKFVVLVSTDNGDNWTILRQWDNAESEYVFNRIACSATGEHVSFDMSAYVGQNVRIAFYAESTESGGDNNLHIDNVLIGIPIPAGEWQTYTTDTTTYTLTGLDPNTEYEVKVESSCPDEISHSTSIVSFTTDVACIAPTELAATEITPTSIELTWMDNNEATSWQIQVNEEDPIDVTTIPYVLENLESNSTYTLKVRANCGVEGYSEWSTAIDVTTLEACPVPADVEVSDITHNSATVAWTGYSDSYVVMIAEGNTLIDADFETGDLSQADFTTTTSYPWAVVNDTITGAHFAKSYSGANSQTSAMELEVTLTAESVLTFSAKISSEAGYDKGYFSIDERDQINGISGNGAWIDYYYVLPAGTHILSWYYTKDVSVSSNDDCFYVDDIVITSFASWDEYTTNAQTYTFNNLTPSTAYLVKVKGVCDDVMTEESEVAGFITEELTTVTQTTALVAGQNWFSTYVEITLDDLKAALVAAMPNARSIVIKSQNAGQTTWNGRLWTGQLRTMDVAQMYMITAPVDCEITLEGMPLDPAEHPLTINNGPNWIGFPFSESMTIANAFAGFASPGDIVKSNGGGQATWNGRIWTGQLKTLVPGSGYIYQSASTTPKTFTYPTSK